MRKLLPRPTGPTGRRPWADPGARARASAPCCAAPCRRSTLHTGAAGALPRATAPGRRRSRAGRGFPRTARRHRPSRSLAMRSCAERSRSVRSMSAAPWSCPSRCAAPPSLPRRCWPSRLSQILQIQAHVAKLRVDEAQPENAKAVLRVLHEAWSLQAARYSAPRWRRRGAAAHRRAGAPCRGILVHAPVGLDEPGAVHGAQGLGECDDLDGRGAGRSARREGEARRPASPLLAGNGRGRHERDARRLEVALRSDRTCWFASDSAPA